jgi:cysteine synthase B
LEGADGAYFAALEEYNNHPDLYFYPDQYNNPVNPDNHYHGTGLEIWQQTSGKVTHFIAGMGTSGTFTGVSRRLKHENPSVKTLAVQPASPFHGIEGTKHMASTHKPGILDESLFDGIVEVTTEAAYAAARRLVREQGLFCGVSSGANVAAALKLAQSVPKNSVIVTILCDTGTRYLSDTFWEGA